MVLVKAAPVFSEVVPARATSTPFWLEHHLPLGHKIAEYSQNYKLLECIFQPQIFL